MDEGVRDDPFGWSSTEELEAKFLAKVDETIGPDVIELSVCLNGSIAVVTGAVYSEEARSRAVRILVAFLKGHRVDDRIQVTAAFEPAADDEWFLGKPDIAFPSSDQAGEENRAAPADRRKAVERHPHVTCDDDLVAGRTINIAVDLTEHALTPASRPITLATLEPGWGELEIEVQIMSLAFSAVGGPGVIVVREDGTSTPSYVSATLRNDIAPNADVETTAIFNCDGRFCGAVPVRLGSIVMDAGDAVNAEPTVEPIIVTQDAGPTMTVTIVKASERDLLWTWSLGRGIAWNSGSRQGKVRLEGEPRSYAAGLMQNCPEMMPADLKRQMGSIGETIWEVTPAEFKAAYLHLREGYGTKFPIQFVLDEFHIPWEMMRPPEGDHIYLTHPVARWPTRRADHPAELPAGQKVTFVPQYEGRGTLPAALRERDWLVENLGARVANASKSDFLDLLSGGDHVPMTSLVHFAGHGNAATEAAAAALHMERGEVIGIRDIDVRETVLGNRDRCLVVLNACEAASVSASLSWVEGWAPAMISRGFGALVAPLWRVQDAVACDVVTSGLQSLYNDGHALGAAFTAARSAVSAKSSAAFAFLTYGDVMATSCR